MESLPNRSANLWQSAATTQRQETVQAPQQQQQETPQDIPENAKLEALKYLEKYDNNKSSVKVFVNTGGD